MKQLHAKVALALLSFLLVACSQEQMVQEQVINQNENKEVAAIDQLPNKSLDESQFGMYHGIVASGTTLSRGKIWINVGNNGHYTATIDIVDGDIIPFTLLPQLQAIAQTTTIYTFESNAGRFTLDVSDYNAPIISNIEIDNQSYFGSVVKSRSMNMASAITAIFSEAENPSFSGTWNLISDGTIQNPNGDGGEGITSLVITFNGNVYTDTDFESFNASLCLGISNYIPTLGANGVADFVICDYQNTEFGAGIAKWDLGYDASTGGYMSWLFCEAVTAGNFYWTSADATVLRNGTIVID